MLYFTSTVALSLVSLSPVVLEVLSVHGHIVLLIVTTVEFLCNIVRSRPHYVKIVMIWRYTNAIEFNLIEHTTVTLCDQ